MSEKNSNRVIASVILALEGGFLYVVARHLVVELFEAGPLSVTALPYAGGVLLASIVFFLMAYTTILDIISGETHEYPGY